MQPGSKVKLPVLDGAETGAELTAEGAITGREALSDGMAVPEEGPEGPATPEDTGGRGAELCTGMLELMGASALEGRLEATLDFRAVADDVTAEGFPDPTGGRMDPEWTGRGVVSEWTGRGIDDVPLGLSEDTPDCLLGSALGEPEGLGTPE